MPDVYNRNSVTKKGYNLLAESIATKKPITFTKVVVGDGDDTGLNIDTMTGLVSPKMELPIGNGEKGGDGEYVIQAVLSNKTLEHSFFPKEVGLFAKCGDGEEVLYSYSNGGNNVGLMPDKNTPINAEIYNIKTKIGNATNITFVTSDDTYVTKGELTKHNTDANAHDNRFNAIIQQVNNMITSVDNSDSLAKAPTLQLVKSMLEKHEHDVNAHQELMPKIKEMVIDLLTWKNVPSLTNVGHLTAANALRKITLPSGWRELSICVSWNGDTSAFNKFKQNLFPGLVSAIPGGTTSTVSSLQVKLSNNSTFSYVDADGFGYSVTANELTITTAGKDNNDYIVGMYYR